LEQKTLIQIQHIQQLEEKLRESDTDKLMLKGDIESLRWEVEELKSSLRAELLELLYPDYVTST